MTQKLVTIYTEASPNPNSLKFVLNFRLLQNINLDFPTIEDADASPLAKALFERFDFVERVFIANNFITLTKKESTDWFEVNPVIKDFIKDYIITEKPVFVDELLDEKIKEDEAPKNTSATEGNADLDEKIKAILNDYVRPAVEQDGGAISFHSFNDGVVKVLLQGSCSGCPSSTLTLKAGIENLLTRMVPEVKEVVAEGV